MTHHRHHKPMSVTPVWVSRDFILWLSRCLSVAYSSAIIFIINSLSITFFGLTPEHKDWNWYDTKQKSQKFSRLRFRAHTLCLINYRQFICFKYQQYEDIYTMRQHQFVSRQKMFSTLYWFLSSSHPLVYKMASPVWWSILICRLF